MRLRFDFSVDQLRSDLGDFDLFDLDYKSDHDNS